MLNSPELQERSKNIVSDYQDGASVAELERIYGVTARWIYMILKAENVTVKRRAKRAVSPLHKQIGARLRDSAFDAGQTNVQVSNALEWTFQKTSSVMQGTYNLSILDLQNLAAYLRVDYNELMTVKRKVT